MRTLLVCLSSMIVPIGATVGIQGDNQGGNGKIVAVIVPQEVLPLSAISSPWSIGEAKEYYGISRWGNEWFGVSGAGEVTIEQGNGNAVSLLDIVKGLNERELQMPVLLRIANHLDNGISRINEAFAKAIAEAGYQAPYRGVFPIKVNQQRHVIEEIAEFGKRYHHGLEAGSKAELLVAMAVLQDLESLIICNGYKDEEFIDLGLHATCLGHTCVFVIETLSELDIIIDRSKALGVAPHIGVRMKLATKVEGHWAEDSGDRSLFGMTATELIKVVDRLKEEDMLSCFELLHFHLGSQIPNIRNIRTGVQEGCRYFIELVKEGVPLKYIDLGGGLAVDYDGSLGGSSQSRNYSLQEYCVDIVEVLQLSMDAEGIPHPVIVTESGRATVAYTSVLLFNILDVDTFIPDQLPEVLPKDSNEAVADLWNIHHELAIKSVQEQFNDTIFYMEKIEELFSYGEIRLREKTLADNIYLAIMQKIKGFLPHMRRVPPELENLPQKLSDIYYGNFSVFQSLPDSWAIEQTFPVMPIHRLEEEPTQQAVFADLTCDCDGKLDSFSGPDGMMRTLAVHPLKPKEEYYFGVFLVGAYQETLGDLHNLFGDTNVVSVRLNENGSFDFVNELHGDSISDVLSYVEYDPQKLFREFRDKAEAAVRDKKIKVAERQRMLTAFSESLRGYTYYER